MANAMGIRLMEREQDCGHFKKRWLIWKQFSNFNFACGYTIHSNLPEHDAQCWREQRKSIKASIQIVDAKPAAAGKKKLERQPGFVRFHICLPENGFCRAETFTLSQDGFLRFLITGQMDENNGSGQF